MPIRHRARALLPALFLLASSAAAAAPQELLYVPEGNRLWRIDIDSFDRGPLLAQIVFKSAADDPLEGRDINGMVCPLPEGPGLFVAGEDTGQPHPPAGWGLLTGYGALVGKLTPTYLSDAPEPYGCVFDSRGRLFTTSTGQQYFGGGNGQLIAWFSPFLLFPGPPAAYPLTDAVSDNACKIATDIATALGVAVDGQDRIYVAAASGRQVLRFSPPFPTGVTAADGCGGRDETGAPRADLVQRETLIGPHWRRGLVTYSGLAFSPRGSLYVSSVATGRIAEFDLDGRLVRMLLEPASWLPPYPTGYPQALAVDARGTLYYVDLDLRLDGLSVDTGPDGKLWRIRFDRDGAPLAPELLVSGLAFPDAVSVMPGDLEAAAAAGLLQPGALGATGSRPEEPRAPGSRAGLLVIVLVLAVSVGALLLALRRRDRPFAP